MFDQFPCSLPLPFSQASCTLRYKAGAPVGQYYVKLMVEDFPTPTPYVLMGNRALSSNPVFLSITGEICVHAALSQMVLWCESFVHIPDVNSKQRQMIMRLMGACIPTVVIYCTVPLLCCSSGEQVV